ncbi:hypothetical protein [Brevibacillus invocatus]|uniref:hypothetical protein n=1 Tax=Brevibacillus invocatus TaxID=173959 RepID=UPI001FEAF3F3|nr:hypothetical protein [Brevibacillus invocatus]
MGQPQLPSLKRSLSLRHTVLFGMAFMAPITVFATYGIALSETNGMVPTGYVFALCIMLVTAYSYGQLVKVYPAAGGAYSFSGKSEYGTRVTASTRLRAFRCHQHARSVEW